MKNFLLAIILVISIPFFAQEEQEKNYGFVRVYDMEGKKIAKGKITSFSDTSLDLSTKSIAIAEIGYIKTKRSVGHNIFVGATLGGGVLGMFGAASGEPLDEPRSFFNSYHTPSEGAAGGLLVGGVVGGALGGISGLFKKSSTILINGDTEAFNSFREMMSK